jgi:hypothetical protein
MAEKPGPTRRTGNRVTSITKTYPRAPKPRPSVRKDTVVEDIPQTRTYVKVPPDKRGLVKQEILDQAHILIALIQQAAAWPAQRHEAREHVYNAVDHVIGVDMRPEPEQ